MWFAVAVVVCVCWLLCKVMIKVGGVDGCCCVLLLCGGVVAAVECEMRRRFVVAVCNCWVHDVCCLVGVVVVRCWCLLCDCGRCFLKKCFVLVSLLIGLVVVGAEARCCCRVAAVVVRSLLPKSFVADVRCVLLCAVAAVILCVVCLFVVVCVVGGVVGDACNLLVLRVVVAVAVLCYSLCS